MERAGQASARRKYISLAHPIPPQVRRTLVRA
jgi:hypothetical protein